MKKQGAILFDLDHTLIDTERIRGEWAAVFAAEGISFMEADAAARRTGPGGAVFHPARSLALIKDPRRRRAARALLAHIYKETGRFDFKGAKELLAGLGKKHDLMLVSFGDRGHQMQKFRQTAFAKLFDGVMITSGARKHRPLAALKKRYAGRVVFVDDSRVAVATARAAGIPAIRIKKGGKDAAYYRKLAPRIEAAFLSTLRQDGM